MVSFGKIYKKASYLEQLRKDYAAVHRDSGEVEKLVAKMKLADEQMAAGGGFLDVLADISQIIPDNIMLTGLQFSGQDKNVVLRGVSSEMSAVFQFLTILEGAPHLQSVKTRNVTKRKVGDKEVAEFEMAANLETEAKPAKKIPPVPKEGPPAQPQPAPPQEGTVPASTTPPAGETK